MNTLNLKLVKNIYCCLIINICLLSIYISNPVRGQSSDYPYRPVKFSDVLIQDKFWQPRIDTNRKVTIPFAFNKCKETGRLKNFEMAAIKNDNPGAEVSFCSRFGYDDSDVYKIIEGAAYSLSAFYDPELDKNLDTLIADIASAQEPDGYIYTMRTISPEKSWAPERWINARTNGSHELYNVGHMYEAAVAHYYATGKNSLLDVAVKNADLLCNTFGPGKQSIASGHQEIEIGLCKLYKVTGEKKYLDLARFLLDQRGVGENTAGEYTQDHKPVIQQDEAVGHAVRANYMYSAMADVAALTGDQSYINAIDKIWHNVVSSKLYITGGVGATSRGEAYGKNYELPNLTAYNETCAAIANVYWNHRMFLLHGDSKYIDVLERTLYNGMISGVSMDGTTFFYPNPLQSEGDYARSEWFDCSCCPSNVTRFVSSLSGYIYALRQDSIYINLFIGNKGSVEINGSKTGIIMQTDYPWSGRTEIILNPAKEQKFSVCIRIPGWTGNEPLPGKLYSYRNTMEPKIMVKLNGTEVNPSYVKGYAVLSGLWKAGDKVEVDFPMEVRTVIADYKVADNRDRISFERGPLVYCAESVDNPFDISNAVIPGKLDTETQFDPDLLNGVRLLKVNSPLPEGDGYNKSVSVQEGILTLIPYYAWAHRGSGKMNVWFYSHDKVFQPELSPASTIFVGSVNVAMKQYEGQTIRYTTDGRDPGQESTVYKEPLRFTTETNLKACAFNSAGKMSGISEAKYILSEYMDKVPVINPLKGMQYRYASGLMKNTSGLNEQKGIKTGICKGFDIVSVRDTSDFYGVEFNGLIDIPSDGVYTFYSESDDGSVVIIDDQLIVDNDGIHGTREKSGQCALRAGFHKILVKYFEYDYGEILNMKISGPAGKKISIPEEWLYYEKTE